MSLQPLKLRHNYSFIALLALFSLLCVACSNERSKRDLKEYMEGIKQQPAKKIEPIPIIPSYDAFTYGAESLRSPFKKREFEIQAEDNDNKPDLNRPKEPLEAFSLDSLNMVGVLSNDGTIWALVATPDGNVHYIKEGDYMGQNYGRVMHITPDEVDLSETVRGTSGWERRPATLLLGK